MAATQSPNLASQTARLDGPQTACTGTAATSESTPLTHAPKSNGSSPPPATQHVGMPTPTTPNVPKPVDPRQAKSPDPENKDHGPHEDESIVDCDGDDQMIGGHGSLFYQTLGGPHADLNSALDERRKNADMRLMQSKAYSQLLEDRVTMLEKTVQGLQGLKQLPTTRDPSNDADKVPVTCPRVDILSWAEFRAMSKVDKKPGSGWTHRPEIEDRTLIAAEQVKGTIEILREEPRFSWEFKSEVRSSSNDEQIPTISELPGLPESQVQDFAEVEPHRIRIRSKLLLKLLDKVTDCNTTPGPYGHRLVLLRPFKLLITFEKRLNEYLDDLNKIHSASTDKNGSFLVQAHEVVHFTQSAHLAIT